MLNNFFGSKARVKILKIFLLNSEAKYYIRQLSRDLSLQVNSVRRELSNLEKFGLLVSNKENNTTNTDNLSNEEGKDSELDKQSIHPFLRQEKKYYQVNKNFVLFQEIEALIIKSQALAGQTFIDRLAQISSPKLLIFTGFFANNPESKTDILLVGEVDRVELLEIISSLEKEINREINYTVMDEKEFLYRREIGDVFLKEILDGRKNILINELGGF